jgi:DNA-binding transcriptional ArsR family regulator
MAAPPPTLAKALAHPTRRRILQITGERVASPREIAAELGLSIGQVSHHVRWLAARGYLELVDTAPRRGAVEHFYRASARPELGAQVVRDIARSALDAIEADALAAPGVHASRTPLTLDEQGRREVADLLPRVIDEVLAIQAHSQERLGDEPGRASELAVLHLDR